MRSTCIFVVCIYIKAWFTAPLAASAPNNDLNLLKTLVCYQKENPAISKAASSKFASHLRYISEELVAWAFFDSAVNANLKRATEKALHERPGQDDSPNRIQLNVEKPVTMSIEAFVTKNSMLFLDHLKILTEFLKTDPEMTELSDNYKTASEIIHHLKVVKDNEERGVG